ncbi:hypothetical protein ACIBHX_39930 [Nonomuraea sp. NPDC050536]|uniref:hypothetical protein n=1 Tax=Nonomuraea sp. NPDC050536 TaxID=3364366 RepID=UPI0037CA79EB
MSETDPGFSHEQAGDVGARRATVGAPTDTESVNVPLTRPGAVENALEAEQEHRPHETFVPEPPISDEPDVPAAHAEIERTSAPRKRPLLLIATAGTIAVLVLRALVNRGKAR